MSFSRFDPVLSVGCVQRVRRALEAGLGRPAARPGDRRRAGRHAVNVRLYRPRAAGFQPWVFALPETAAGHPAWMRWNRDGVGWWGTKGGSIPAVGPPGGGLGDGPSSSHRAGAPRSGFDPAPRQADELARRDARRAQTSGNGRLRGGRNSEVRGVRLGIRVHLRSCRLSVSPSPQT